jgi:hypothetical protein
MDNPLVWMISAIALYLSLVWVLNAAANRSMLKDAQAIAIGVGGHVERDPHGCGYLIRFEANGVKGTLTFSHHARATAPSWTRMDFELGGEAWLELFPASFWESLGKKLGIPQTDLEIGDLNFDRRYIIQGGPEDWVRRFLNAGTRAVIDRLQEMGGSFPLHLSRHNPRFSIRLDRGFTRAGLELFVGECLTLLRQLLVSETIKS